MCGTLPGIDVSHNCGDSKTGFSGVFRVFEAQKRRFFDRKSLIRLAQLELLEWVTPIALDSTRGATTDRKSTGCDQKSTGCDNSMSFARTSMSFRDTFASVRARCKSRLTSDRLRFFDFWRSYGLFFPRWRVGLTGSELSDYPEQPIRKNAIWPQVGHPSSSAVRTLADGSGYTRSRADGSAGASAVTDK